MNTHPEGAGRRLAGTTAWVLTAGVVLAMAACSAGEEPPLQGYVEAELLHVAPASAGTLARVTVARGQRVAAGQPLFEMDATPEARAAEAAAARQGRAAAQWANLRSGKRPLELLAIDQQQRQAGAALAAAESALQRQSQLVEQGFVSASRLDELRAARDREQARVGELQAQRAQAQQAARRDEIEAAAAEAHAAQADAALADWRQGQTLRTAPRAGQVFDVVHRPGEVVAAGAPVVSLLPDGELKLLFFVPEPLLPRAAVGSLVQVACDGCAPGLQARIRWVSPQAEYTPPVLYGNEARAKLVFRVEAEPIEGATLHPGQPVDVRLAAASSPR